MKRSHAEMTAAKKRGDDGDPVESETRKTFPWMLHALLDDAEKNGNDHIISWTPSGTSFRVHDRNAFMKTILPRYFRQTKFKSFVRYVHQLRGCCEETRGRLCRRRPWWTQYDRPLAMKQCTFSTTFSSFQNLLFASNQATQSMAIYIYWSRSRQRLMYVAQNCWIWQLFLRP